MLDTNSNSAFSTETENFKFNPNNIILQSNIDPSDWRREVNRVSKNLEIPEHPEFLISNSNYSDGSLANSKNIFEILNNTNEDITTKLNCFHNFLNKATKNNSNFEMLNNCSDQIQNELNIIQKFEKIISSKGNLKGKIQKANETIKEGKEKQENFSEFEEKVNLKENLLEEITERIRVNKEKEENRESNTDPKKESHIKERIKELKVIFYFKNFYYFCRVIYKKWI